MTQISNEELRKQFFDNIKEFNQNHPNTLAPETEENYQAWLRIADMFDVNPFEDGFEEADRKISISMEMQADEYYQNQRY